MGQMESFEQMIEQERARLGKLREDLRAQQQTIVGQLADIEKELAAIAAYEQAKLGVPGRQPRAAKGTRVPRGAQREEVLALIKASPDLTRGEIIERLGVKGDKPKEQGVSNALAAMKKAGVIRADEGKYTAAAGASA